MIAFATPAPARRLNLPTFRQGWTTAQGKVKAGFWMFRHNGKYVSLTAYGAPPEEGKTKTDLRRNEALAVAARDKYLADLAGAVEKKELAARIKANEVVTVWHVCELYTRCKLPSSSPSYRARATAILNSFCKGHEGNDKRGVKPYSGWGKLPAEDLHEGIIADWASHHAWGQGGLQSAVVPVKAAYAFAASHSAQGIRATGKIKPLISADPLRTFKAHGGEAREEVFSAEQEQAFRSTAAKVNPALLTIASALLELGARPNELRVLKARHFDGEQFVLQPGEWKCGKKTRRCRFVGLSPKWIEWATTRLESMGDNDFFFTTVRGKGWTKTRFNSAWKAVVEKAGLPASHTPYVARHSFITRACAKGLAPVHSPASSSCSNSQAWRRWSSVMVSAPSDRAQR